MPLKLSNPSYSYSAGGIVSVSATVDILAADGVTVIYQAGISGNAHIGSDWKTALRDSLIEQATVIKQNYDRTMYVVALSYPLATSPAEALAQFVAEVDAALTGV